MRSAMEVEDGEGESRQEAAGRRNTCEECKKEVAKYKCPGCSLRSCSLSCVRAHKERTSCSGKRDRTAFVPIDSFDDALLLSDYNLLEEVLRLSDSAKRFRAPFNTRKLKPYDCLMILKRQARRRNINLVILSRGMTKRVENSTWYCKRSQCIFWRIEWRFHLTNLVLISARADENESPAKLLERQLGNKKHSRTEFIKQLRKVFRQPIEDMRFLVVKQMCGGMQKKYIELDPLEPFGAQLDQLTVIEYPTILVVSPDDDTSFTVIEDRRSWRGLSKLDPLAEKLLADVREAESKPVPYMEEDIEEGEIVD